MRDHYEVLQIGRDASTEEIQHAYRTLAMRHHPDRNPALDAAARMAAINEAYEVLRDPVQRRVYDMRMAANSHTLELAVPVLFAARDMISRAGWTLVQEDHQSMLLECAKQRVRVVFASRLTGDGLQRLSKRYTEFLAVLTLSIEGPIVADSRTAVVDLLHSERHGAAIPTGAGKSLLAAFL